MRHRRRRSKRRALVAATVVVVVLAGVLVWYLTRTTGPPPYTLDVKPGYTVAEVANQLGGHIATSFVKVSHTVPSQFQPSGNHSLEGLLGTGDYQVTADETAEQLLTTMVDRFDHQAAAAGLNAKSAAKLGMSEYDVVIAASIVEKEGYYDKNMGKVARVIVNRLAQGMTLDMTSTVLFSLGQDGGTVTPHDRQLDTPYNTYKHAGLTPTPICFPSMAALRAAVDPTPGTWLYFVVVDKDGTEAFSTTYTQQIANEKLAASRGLG